MVFPLRSTTERTIHRLDNAIMTTTEKMRQDRSIGIVMFELFFYSDGIVHM